MKIWARIRKDNKTIEQETIDLPAKRADEVMDWNEPIGELCHNLNLARPVILDKHKKELLLFSGTAFRADDFIEKIAFDRLEIELF
ncbi:MAG: hypothetical protein IKS90_03925 [Clostridia bacterium]|nr:hypothetical protein [Clostridia bacterium]